MCQVERHDAGERYAGSIFPCCRIRDAVVFWSDLGDLGGRHFFCRDRMVFEVPPIISDFNCGWCVPYKDVTGEGDDVAIEHGTVGVGERGFSNAPEDSDAAGQILDDDEEGWPLFSCQGY